MVIHRHHPPPGIPLRLRCTFCHSGTSRLHPNHRPTDSLGTRARTSRLQHRFSTLFPLAAHRRSHSPRRPRGLLPRTEEVLRINHNIGGCGVVADPIHAPSRAPFLLATLLLHNIPATRVDGASIMAALGRQSLISSWLIASFVSVLAISCAWLRQLSAE